MGSVATVAVWYGCHGGFWKGHRVFVGFGSPGSDWQVVTSSGKARLGRKCAKEWIVEV